MKEKALFSVGTKDLIKGLIVSVLTSTLTLVGTSIEAGHLPIHWIDWKPILMTGLGTCVSYIIKNWLTNSNGEFAKKETTSAPETKPQEEVKKD